jgi:hypothetical protein
VRNALEVTDEAALSLNANAKGWRVARALDNACVFDPAYLAVLLYVPVSAAAGGIRYPVPVQNCSSGLRGEGGNTRQIPSS